MVGIFTISLKSVINNLIDIDRDSYKEHFDVIYTYCEESLGDRPKSESVCKLLATSIIVQTLEFMGIDGVNPFINCVEHFIQPEETFLDDEETIIVEETYITLAPNLLYDDYGSAYSTMEELLHDIITYSLPTNTLRLVADDFRLVNSKDTSYSYISFGQKVSDSKWCVGG